VLVTTDCQKRSIQGRINHAAESLVRLTRLQNSPGTLNLPFHLATDFADFDRIRNGLIQLASEPEALMSATWRESVRRQGSADGGIIYEFRRIESSDGYRAYACISWLKRNLRKFHFYIEM
jgi:hypothetical protein